MTALVIIYNHKYDKNIPILERIYQYRFSHIFHLVPFYTGDKDNVISVYENSYYFQGYVAQAYQQLMMKGNFDHYLFIGDDLLLNPKITENNYLSYFEMGTKDAFITEINEFDKMEERWPHIKKVLNYTPNVEGLEIMQELPPEDSILMRFKKYGYEKPRVDPKFIYDLPERLNYPSNIKGRYYYNKDKKNIQNILCKGMIDLPFPSLGGYSDIFIIPQEEFKSFAHICGVLAASHLFVEAAIPTAMVLSCNSIKLSNDIQREIHPFWDNRNSLESKHNSSLKNLYDNFPDNILCIHPVKLSKWTIDL